MEGGSAENAGAVFSAESPESLIPTLLTCTEF